MKLRTVTIAYALVLAIAFASAAAAQYESSDRSRIGLKMSVFRPTGSDLKTMNDNWLGPVLDYNVSFDEFDRPRTIVSIGSFSEQGQYTEASVIPITATYFKRFGEDKDSAWYVGGGLGLYITKFKYVYLNEDKNKILGYHISAGREFSVYYVDLRLDLVNKMLYEGVDISFSGWTLSLGSHYTF
ncbi:MAG: hypothetical protein A2Z18_00850 [Armatimonadetes bacterium RBG_16_58_9]|nr:MAG: hypothetical protein A2Z18_00850 [Armatimonadetes bacterium RBG_16_58_9]